MRGGGLGGLCGWGGGGGGGLDGEGLTRALCWTLSWTMGLIWSWRSREEVIGMDGTGV